MAKVILTGGTGMVGSALCKILLARGDEVIIFTTRRNVKDKIPLVQYVYWNPAEMYIDPAFTAEDCVLINLAGAAVAEKRWTDSRKKEIADSRIMSLQTLFKAAESKQLTITRLISASAIGYYGTKDGILSEEDAPDSQFLSQICQQWEKEASAFETLDIPVSIVRIGIVLSTRGGFLKTFLQPIKFGICPVPGNGAQIVSWIHIDDLCDLVLYLMDRKINGVYNAVADQPVSMLHLLKTILHIKKGIRIFIPTFLFRILLGEMSTEILKSAHISNQKIREKGYDFEFKQIETAVQHLLT